MFNPFDPRTDGDLKLAAIKGTVSGIPGAVLVLLGWYLVAILVQSCIIAFGAYLAFFAKEKRNEPLGKD